jgi:hypothetical protein
MPSPAPAPKCQIKKCGEGRERRIIMWLGTRWRGTVSTHLIFIHLWNINMSYGLNRQRIGGRGQKVCIQFSHRCGLVGHCVTLCSGRGSSIVTWSWAGGPSKGAPIVGSSFSPFLWRCYGSFLPIPDSKVATGDCRGNSLEQRQIKNAGEMSCFFPAFS